MKVKERDHRGKLQSQERRKFEVAAKRCLAKRESGLKGMSNVEFIELVKKHHRQKT